MRFFLIVFIASIFNSSLKAQLVQNPSYFLTEIDFNYLNKGIWELSSNGYLPREDLIMIKLYGNKQQSTDWYFMCHKICKNGIDLGYIITGKPNSTSMIVHNLFFLKQNSTVATNHNRTKIDQLKALSLLNMFMFRATSTELYNLDSECPK